MGILLRICTLASLLLPGAAFAGVPSPANSTVPACAVFCPGGDIVFTVVVRDLAFNTLSGSQVVLDLCSCGTHVCLPQHPSDDYSTYGSCGVWKFTNSSGVATFHLRAGGVCSGSNFRIYADGVLLASRNIASPDQNGDLIVTPADAAVLAPKVGGFDPTGDLDCDTAVTSADQTVLQSHLSHTCLSPTETARRTWGDLKILYR